MCPSSPILSDVAEEILSAAQAIGFPVLVKPANGGGGIGMLAANNAQELLVVAERARSLASRSFDDAKIYLEQLLLEPRHIEFQVLADKSGTVRHVFERDCSVQRRHQKVIEEAPAPALPRQVVEAMAMQIQGVLGEIGYDNIGTVETLYDANAGFSFLEMNTRLQVEHAVTEEITGIDLVAAQVRLAAGHAIDDVLPAQIAINGHAIEARVYAEDPKRFFPSPGTLKIYRPPSDGSVRIETGYAEGNVVTPHYDPMLAKVIAHGSTRDEAITRLQSGLAAFEVQGVKTNIPFVMQVLADDEFRGGRIHTGLTAGVLARSS
jgi:acetyl-CoA carboxylase biotin carboxylase subunit